MSLLQDLQNLDLSGIVEARGSITLALTDPQLQALLEGGAARAVLGELGQSLASLRDTLDSPAALLQPLLAALTELAGPLNLSTQDIGPYLRAVREGGEILSRLLADFDGDPATLGKVFGASLNEVLERTQATFTDMAPVDLGEAARFRELVAVIETGVPAAPGAFVDLALEILLPFPKESLYTVRDSVQGVLDRAQGIALPRTRSAQLELRLNAVAAAAAAGDAAAVQRELRELDQVRLSTGTAIAGDLQAAAYLLDGLRVDEAMGAIAAVSGTLRGAGDGILEFLARLERDLAELRAQIGGIDPTRITAFIDDLLDTAETRLRVQIGEAIDEQVERLKEWLRSLLRHLPLRPLRVELTQLLQRAAQAVIDADLDRFAREAHELLAGLRTQIEAGDLGDRVRAVLEDIERAITGVLDQLATALETITGEIDAVAAEAQAVLGRVVEALHGFQETLAGIVQAVDNLGIEAAAQQVIDTLAGLRETAEQLLSEAPLPEPLRPLVEQLIETIRGVDVDAAFDPVRAAAGELTLPAEVENTLTEALAKARDCLEQLIPRELIEGIEREVETLLNEIRNFDPASLLSGVGGFIEEAAGFIEGLNLGPAQIATLRAPFQALLDGFDQVHPRRLLAPVIEAYDGLFGQINMPPPQATAERIGQSIGSVGEAVGRAVVEPVRQMAPPGMIAVAEAGQPPPAATDLPSLAGVRPGDIVRMFGYLPNKLRLALQGLEAGAAGEVLQTLEGVTFGLAQSLRRLRDTLWAIEERLNGDLDALLLPLGQAQLNAQLALQANFSAGPLAASLDLGAALETVHQAGPGSLRLALGTALDNASGRARAVAMTAGGDPGAGLARIADLLDSVSLSRLAGDLDGLLAALDPEPIAAEADALILAVVNRTPELFGAVETEMQAIAGRITRLLEQYSPGTQAQKFLTLLDVLREELDLINPARLAAELGEIHDAVRASLLAYDPARLAESLAEVLGAVAGNLRALDPAALLGDLGFLDGLLDRVEAASPTRALAGVGDSLQTVGEELTALDPGALLGALQGLGPRVIAEFERAIEAIKQELITLLESLQYFAGSASVSAEASVG